MNKRIRKKLTNRITRRLYREKDEILDLLKRSNLSSDIYWDFFYIGLSFEQMKNEILCAHRELLKISGSKLNG